VIFLGVDPGTAVTGYGVVVQDPQGALALRECGVIRTSPRAPLADRLQDIHEGVCEVIDRHDPDRLSVEDVFYGKNVRTAMVLGHARGVILLAGARRGIPVHEYSPAEVKNAVVGRGGADKHQVAFMVQRLLSLREPPAPSDAADGVAVALCDCFQAAGPLARMRMAAGRPA